MENLDSLEQTEEKSILDIYPPLGKYINEKEEFIFDWKTYDISFAEHFYLINNPQAEQAEKIDKIYDKIHDYVKDKCQETGEYVIDQWKERLTVRKKDDVDKIRYDSKTDEEKKVYDEQKTKEAIDNKKMERNRVLEDTDKYILEDFPITEEEKTLWKRYRKYLRDLPKNVDFPNVDILKFEEWCETLEPTI